MNFLFDESADLRLRGRLERQGHDVASVAADYKPGLSDAEVLALAREGRRILITEDRDFGDLVIRRGERHFGVIYLRLGDASLPWKQERLNAAVAVVASATTPPFLVVQNTTIREAPIDTRLP